MITITSKSVLKNIVEYCELPFNTKALDSIKVYRNCVEFCFDEWEDNHQEILINDISINVEITKWGFSLSVFSEINPISTLRIEPDWTRIVCAYTKQGKILYGNYYHPMWD